MRAIVIGGGIGGLAAARRMAQGGADVIVLEAAPALGGLVDDFEVAGTSLERFYHYLLPGEPDILELIHDLGLDDLVEWHPSTIGILTGGKIWRFTTPMDLIRFAPLGAIDRVRAGLGALRLSRIHDWRSLDERSARSWLTELTSPAVTAVVWDPLLRAKFGSAGGRVPAAWMWGRLQQRRGARAGFGERLGYLRGGFRILLEALADDARGYGVTLRTSARVDRIVTESTRDGARVTGVKIDREGLPADVVLYAGALPAITQLLPEDLHDERWTTARGLGCACVVFDVPYALTDVFWTNVCDERVPFGGIIEHTNLVPRNWYGGRHVVYLSRYFTAEDDLVSSDPDDLAKTWLTACESLFPHFSAADVGDLQVSITGYAAPLVTSPYLPAIPPNQSAVDGLWLATTAQIYPQDRGMSEGIKRAHHVADAILGRGKSVVEHGRTPSDPDEPSR